MHLERSAFFNSVNGDRKYKAEDFAEYFNSFIGNGVFPNPSTNLQVISNSDMTVTVKPGKAWINGYIYINDDDLMLQLEPADGVLSRIDRIVIRLDTVDREIMLEVKKGEFASEPTPKDLQRDADAYELAIADIRVNKGATSITQADITDLRLNKELCGIVHGTVDQVDTTTLFNQYLTWLDEKKTQYDTDMLDWTEQKQQEYQTWYDNLTATEQQEIDDMQTQFQQDWDTWFATVQGALDGDTAGNLLNLIENHKNDKNNPHNVTVEQIGAETPAGARAKVDAAEASAKAYTGQEVGKVKQDSETHKAETIHQIKVAQVSNFQATPDDVMVHLSWSNPADVIVTDNNGDNVTLAKFAGVKIIRKEGNVPPTNKNDGILVYDGIAENFSDINVINYQEYSYSIFAYTKGGNYSSPVCLSVTPVPYTMDYTAGVSNFEVVGATELGSQAELSWINPTDVNCAGVLVRRSNIAPPATIDEGAEIYNGTGTSVTDAGLINGQIYYYTIWAYSANNEYSDNVNKKTGSAEVMKGQDGSGSPGSAVLIAGDTTEGFFGEVPANDLITGDALASQVGISQGVSQHSTAGWLKFAYKGKIQFIAKKPIRNSISWDAINTAKCVYGDSGDKTIEIGGLTYKVRLMRALASSNDPKTVASANSGIVNHYSEWNRLMCQIHEQAISKSWDYPDNIENDIGILEHNLGNGTQGMYNDVDLVVKSGDGSYSWCQEMSTSTSSRLHRGRDGVSHSGYYTSSGTNSRCGWRPVLELVPKL